jgi:hypothetical protein
MAGKGDHPAPRLEDPDLSEMRVFGRNPAEIVPHASDYARYLGLGNLRKGALQVAAGALGDAEKGADAAPQRTADRRGAIERQ